MKLRLIIMLLALVPVTGFAASRTPGARVGMAHAVAAQTSGVAAKRAVVAQQRPINNPVAEDAGQESDIVDETDITEEKNTISKKSKGDGSCRQAYNACMDEFCLLDESEGERCACSSNINKSKTLILEIQKIQDEADKLYTEGVEREKLGAKAKYVFGQSEKAKSSSRASGISFAEWLRSDTGDDENLGEDTTIGDGLYEMAAEYCADELDACGTKAEMEEALYERQIVKDCKSFESYLTDQKRNAEANKRTAESAVRAARLEMLDTTNKYNRGECLLAYKSCISDKGGCGVNFENCLDAGLLERRSHACENVLDQCMASRDYVLKDWGDESESILANAAKYADKYARQTCLARIQGCLEEGCSTSTNAACLTDVKVAAGVCPVIDECNKMIPGIKSVVNDKLGYLRLQFCQNDVDKCLRNKCGENFTAPECLGKKTSEIVELCPQDMFPSCKGEEQYDIIVSSALLQMDYQMLQGCLNYFGEELGKVCGTDMACLPSDTTVESLTLSELPTDGAGFTKLRQQVRDNANNAVENFFADFEKNRTISACIDSEKPKGRRSMKDSVFSTAKLIAHIGAENRALRALEEKVAELSRQQDVKKAEKLCLDTYKVETKPTGEDKKNYSYIKSVSFEPSLRNCHVCRMQQVCEKGGESKGTAAVKGAAGGLAAGASAGTMVSPGWGTAIGGVIGAVGGGLMTGLTAKEEEYCQELESCEDVNM